MQYYAGHLYSISLNSSFAVVILLLFSNIVIIDVVFEDQVTFQELKKGHRIFEDFVDDGLIEYLDVNEMNDASIAVYENQIKPNTTHLEVCLCL